MAMNQSTLSTELANMVPVDNEVDAINNLSTAFENYFYQSSVAGIVPIAGALAAPISAMKSAFTGLSTDASTAIQSGITAFWGAAVASAPTIWITTPLIISATVPPSLSTIKSTLDAVFVSNLMAEFDLDDAANAVAVALHPINLGGIVVIGPPPPGGTPTPIL
jgi:hypothetical protein